MARASVAARSDGNVLAGNLPAAVCVQEALKHYMAAAAVRGASKEAVATAQDAAAALQERLRLLNMFRQASEFAAGAPNECLSICQSLLTEVCCPVFEWCRIHSFRNTPQLKFMLMVRFPLGELTSTVKVY